MSEEINRKEMNIYQKMECITAELGTVAKNLDVKAGKNNSYKAVSERDIIDAVKPIEHKYGIYSYPCSREILESSILESENDYGKKSTFFTRIKTTYMFVNTDNPDERMTTEVFSEGIDPQDKGSGKAMTYADKYALMKMYKISTGDDTDQNGSEENNYRRTNSGGRNQNQGQTSGQQNSQGGGLTRCGKCNSIIMETTTRDGQKMAASEVAYYSIRRFGAAYCPDCQNEIIKNRIEQRNKQQEAAAGK